MAEKAPEAQPEGSFFTSIRGWGITRGRQGWLGGVIEGLGNRVGMAAAPARLIAFIGFVVLGGLFTLAYALAWALLPDEDGHIIIQDFGRGTPNVGALVMIALLGLLGMSSVDTALPFHLNNNGDFGEFVVSAIFIGIAVLVVWLVARGRRNNAVLGETPAAMPAHATAAPGAAASTASAAKATNAADAAPRATTAGPAPVAPRPPVPYTPGPGRTVYLATFGVLILAAAAVAYAEYLGRLAVAPFAAWSALALIIVGAAIAATGALGRRIGFFGFLASVLVIGWLIAIFAAPRVDDWVDDNVTITVDGVEYSVDELRDEVPWDEYNDSGDGPDISVHIGED